MATPIGTDAITAISRRFILPQITDQFYLSNALFHRLYRSNRKVIRGGTQIEVPLMYTDWSAAGVYRGFDLLDTTPQDVFKNAAYDWKQYYVNVAVDGLSLIKNDSPESVANLITKYFEVARSKMEDQVGNDLFSDAVTNTSRLDGLQGAIDNGSVAATYAGLNNRTTTNSFWQPATGALDTTTTTLSYGAMRTVFGAATSGARHPTIIITTQANYNRFAGLFQPQQRFPSQGAGVDEQLAKAGYTNILFDNVPVVVDSHCNTTRLGVTGDHMYFLNETYMELVVNARADMTMKDFQQPINQDAMVAPLLFAGDLVFSNLSRQGLMTAITN